MNAPLPPSVRPPTIEERIREAAYYRWLECGCPVGDDLAHWFAAEKQLSETAPTSASTPSPRHSDHPPFSWPSSPSGAAATHLKPVSRPDHRPEILAGGAVQRTRGRHGAGGSGRSARA